MRIDIRAVASAVFVAAALTFGYGTSALAQSEIHVKAGSLSDHECVASEWHFIINQLSAGQAPASIMVTWEGGASATVVLTKTTGSTAHYTTTANLGVPVTDATATIEGDWSGQFVLSHGPCSTAAAAATVTTGQVAVAGVQTAPQQGAATGQQTIGQGTAAGQQNAPHGTAVGGVESLPSTSTNSDANLLASLMSLALLPLALGVAALVVAARRRAARSA